jgi:hypothetical protein
MTKEEFIYKNLRRFSWYQMLIIKIFIL